MLNKIQITNNSASQQLQAQNENVLTKPNFYSKSIVNEADAFETQSNKEKKPKNKLELELVGITGVLATVGAVAHHRLGTIIKTVGEKVPSMPWTRLSKVFELASKDGMTGLFNKQALLTSLSREYKQAVAKGEIFSVAMVDMDNFKGFNEVFGHDVGDTVLKRIAANMLQVAEKHGVKVFRYGGEEFVVTISGKDAEASKKIIEEIAEAIKSDKVIQDYLPGFNKQAKEDIDFITEKSNLLSSIFPQLRKGQKVEAPEQLRDNIISLIEAHLQKYEPSDSEVLDEIVSKLRTIPIEELPKILQGEIKFGEQSTLGEELNKINSQYKGLKHDLQKCTNHTSRHKMFTISGGLVNLDASNIVENSEDLIKIADAALKSAKQNGKNTIVLANEKIIRKIVEKPGA